MRCVRIAPVRDEVSISPRPTIISSGKTAPGSGLDGFTATIRGPLVNDSMVSPSFPLQLLQDVGTSREELGLQALQQHQQTSHFRPPNYPSDLRPHFTSAVHQLHHWPWKEDTTEASLPALLLLSERITCPTAFTLSRSVVNFIAGAKSSSAAPPMSLLIEGPDLRDLKVSPASRVTVVDLISVEET